MHREQESRLRLKTLGRLSQCYSGVAGITIPGAEGIALDDHSQWDAGSNSSSSASIAAVVFDKPPPPGMRGRKHTSTASESVSPMLPVKLAGNNPDGEYHCAATADSTSQHGVRTEVRSPTLPTARALCQSQHPSILSPGVARVGSGEYAVVEVVDEDNAPKQPELPVLPVDMCLGSDVSRKLLSAYYGGWNNKPLPPTPTDAGGHESVRTDIHRRSYDPTTTTRPDHAGAGCNAGDEPSLRRRSLNNNNHSTAAIGVSALPYVSPHAIDIASPIAPTYTPYRPGSSGAQQQQQQQPQLLPGPTANACKVYKRETATPSCSRHSTPKNGSANSSDNDSLPPSPPPKDPHKRASRCPDSHPNWPLTNSYEQSHRDMASAAITRINVDMLPSATPTPRRRARDRGGRTNKPRPSTTTKRPRTCPPTPVCSAWETRQKRVSILDRAQEALERNVLAKVSQRPAGPSFKVHSVVRGCKNRNQKRYYNRKNLGGGGDSCDVGTQTDRKGLGTEMWEISSSSSSESDGDWEIVGGLSIAECKRRRRRHNRQKKRVVSELPADANALFDLHGGAVELEASLPGDVIGGGDGDMGDRERDGSVILGRHEDGYGFFFSSGSAGRKDMRAEGHHCPQTGRYDLLGGGPLPGWI